MTRKSSFTLLRPRRAGLPRGGEFMNIQELGAKVRAALDIQNQEGVANEEAARRGGVPAELVGLVGLAMASPAGVRAWADAVAPCV